MKIIVAHSSPDWDAIGSIWLLKKYLSGWGDATVAFVPAGTLLKGAKGHGKDELDPIEVVGEDEIIHVDTGLGPLDHHQTSDKSVCAATRSWDFVREVLKKSGNELTSAHDAAVTKVVEYILSGDHFREVFWADPAADYQEFSLIGLLDGMKLYKPDDDRHYVSFGMECLNAMVHTFESRLWAMEEIEKNGKEFKIKMGKAIAFETVNDNVVKLSQKMGYLLAVRKDPRKGYVRIKVRPASSKDDDLDLTAAYEKLSKIDTEATWFLHVSKKMLLNGTPKNPKMIPTALTLEQIIDILKSIY
ncbi:MAG: hypothetical protein KBC15_00795 [Candidatus Levybacteria bacterium]|nr:hypothetical protein [Candidatus Levybacteria bacterium]